MSEIVSWWCVIHGNMPTDYCYLCGIIGSVWELKEEQEENGE